MKLQRGLNCIDPLIIGLPDNYHETFLPLNNILDIISHSIVCLGKEVPENKSNIEKLSKWLWKKV